MGNNSKEVLLSIRYEGSDSEPPGEVIDRVFQLLLPAVEILEIIHCEYNRLSKKDISHEKGGIHEE